LKVNKTQFCNL